MRGVLLLSTLATTTTAIQWLLHGGYTGFEGQPDQGATAEVEVLTLNNPNDYASPWGFCHRNLSTAPQPLDGATMDEVSTFKYIENTLKTAGTGKLPYFGSSHHSAQFQRLLVCGGADDKYVVQKSCMWWSPEKDLWEAGPTMLHPRYQAASVSLPYEGRVWVLGGRDGSTVLQDNEVLQYPVDWMRQGSYPERYTLKRWEWANKKMKNIAVWNNGVPGDDATNPGMKKLPMPLTGHCALLVGTGTGAGSSGKKGVLVIGGGTNPVREDGTFKLNSPPIPTNHIHFYHRGGSSNTRWSSTFVSPLVTGTKAVAKMSVPRMNHACLKIGNLVYVAGGVTWNSFNQSLPLNKVEVYNTITNTWKFEADLPNLITGIKLIEVKGRPTVVGRYGKQLTNTMFRYSDSKIWEPLPARILVGRSDFQVMVLPSTVTVYPDMNSAETKLNKGGGAEPNWRNLFGSVVDGKRQIFRSNRARRPWVQLDLGEEMVVKRVSNLKSIQ